MICSVVTRVGKKGPLWADSKAALTVEKKAQSLAGNSAELSAESMACSRAAKWVALWADTKEWHWVGSKEQWKAVRLAQMMVVALETQMADS